MQTLHNYVISDTFSLIYWSLKIIHEIQKFEIQIYQLPYCDEDEDDEFKKQTEDLRVRVFIHIK